MSSVTVTQPAKVEAAQPLVKEEAVKDASAVTGGETETGTEKTTK